MNIEVITIKEEIKIVGLSYLLMNLPGTLESLNDMWKMYGEKYRGKVSNAATPPIDYGVNANNLGERHEYIAGCAVTQIGRLDVNWACYIVPPGQYIKHTRQKMSELFEHESDVKAWADANNIKIDDNFMVEVYPAGAFEDGGVEVYTLHPITCGFGKSDKSFQSHIE